MNSNEIKYYQQNGLPPLLAQKYKFQNGVLVSIEGKFYCPEDKKYEIIQAFLEDPRTTGGRDRLYGHISSKYLNISRRDVASHLANDPVHQQHRPLKKKTTVRPIIVKNKGVVAQIDLVDMSNYAGHNNQVKFLLTYVDAFSKWCAVRALSNKTQAKVVEALQDILHNDLKLYNHPTLIQADNGKEFSNLMKQMLDKEGIKLIHSAPYTPQTNGGIERFNRTIKSAIFEYMTRANTKKYIDVLPAFVDNYNSTKHSTTNHSPNDLMKMRKLPNETVAMIQQRMTPKVIEEKNNDDLNINDFVRVALTTDKEIRKQKFRKKILQNWSQPIFQIYSISQPEYRGMKEQYLLKNMDTNRKSKKRYFAYQLLKTNYDPNAIQEEQNAQEIIDEQEEQKQPVPAIPALAERKQRIRQPSLAYLQQFSH